MDPKPLRLPLALRLAPCIIALDWDILLNAETNTESSCTRTPTDGPEQEPELSSQPETAGAHRPRSPSEEKDETTVVAVPEEDPVAYSLFEELFGPEFEGSEELVGRYDSGSDMDLETDSDSEMLVAEADSVGNESTSTVCGPKEVI
uniref:Uncharacterized protein n=1 Tax=Mycena chlorophos TaxID=658473 RepID=A0ABQ0MCP3_MYCCL|nr:predicted protein [Mycena chlorophos]